MLNEDDIQRLENPLTTEDGFINPACMNELEAALKNMPRTYERLADDIEWNTLRITNRHEITGHFACWAVRQQNRTSLLPNFENILNYLDACLRKEFAKQPEKVLDREQWGEYSLCQINKMLFDILWDLPVFLEWNDKNIVGEEWLDLHALLHNVCISIRDERRKNDKFDKEFERQWSEKNIYEK